MSQPIILRYSTDHASRVIREERHRWESDPLTITPPATATFALSGFVRDYHRTIGPFTTTPNWLNPEAPR